MRRIGHRGAKGHAPDNTMPSFQKALDLGCDEIETDVWLMRDGALVISHDRPASSDGLLSLDQVLDFCRGRMGVNVEIKWEGGETTEAGARDSGAKIAAHIAKREDSSVYISSFWWAALDAARRSAPSVRRAFLFSASPPRAALLVEAKSTGLWALHPNRNYVTEELVRDAHAAKLVVQAWTVNDPVEIARFAALGVDGLMSDFPERIPK
jgi:glycerophosphoryl diester phosphodiesterase